MNGAWRLVFGEVVSCRHADDSGADNDGVGGRHDSGGSGEDDQRYTLPDKDNGNPFRKQDRCATGELLKQDKGKKTKKLTQSMQSFSNLSAKDDAGRDELSSAGALYSSMFDMQ